MRMYEIVFMYYEEYLNRKVILIKRIERKNENVILFTWRKPKPWL